MGLKIPVAVGVDSKGGDFFDGITGNWPSAIGGWLIRYYLPSQMKNMHEHKEIKH